MGDRANILVKQHSHIGGKEPNGAIFIYTHWSGSELPHILQRALVRGKSRWDDEPYLTRIIVSEVIGKDNWDGLTGVGVSTYMGDNSYPLLVVDSDEKTVGVSFVSDHISPPFKTVSFEEYVKLSKKELDKFRGDS
jgi:hypothetical protein